MIHQAAFSTSRYAKSSNWAGASIVPHDGNRFVLMLGEWEIPTPSLPPPAERGDPGDDIEYHCSTWIGLDGNRRYRNSSLPQIGTEQVLRVSASNVESFEYSVWFQWWAHKQVAITWQKFNNITVMPGKPVVAAIWVVDPTHVTFFFRTFDPVNALYILPMVPSPEVWADQAGGAKMRPEVSGATAEWIMERPLTFSLTDPKPELFPSYTPVTFEVCVAGAARTPGLPTSEEILTSPRFFRMYEVPAQLRPRTRLISMASPVSTTSVRVHYGGFV